MKKLFVFLMTVLCLSIVISCSNKKEQADNLPQMVDVALTAHTRSGKNE